MCKDLMIYILLTPGFCALLKGITWEGFPKYLQDEISGTEGKAETRQTFGAIMDLASILQIISYWYYPIWGIPEDVIHLNKEHY